MTYSPFLGQIHRKGIPFVIVEKQEVYDEEKMMKPMISVAPVLISLSALFTAQACAAVNPYLSYGDVGDGYVPRAVCRSGA